MIPIKHFWNHYYIFLYSLTYILIIPDTVFYVEIIENIICIKLDIIVDRINIEGILIK